jgi:hypothetical protein
MYYTENSLVPQYSNLLASFFNLATVIKILLVSLSLLVLSLFLSKKKKGYHVISSLL